MADAEEIEVPLDDPKPDEAEIEVARAEDAPIAAKVIEPEEGLETLRAQLEQEKAGRLADQAARRAAEEDANRAKTEVADTNTQLVTNAIATLKQANDTLEEKSAEAMGAGDFVESAKIHREMLRNEAKLNDLENGLERMKSQPKPAASSSDPVEALASQLTPASAAWLRAHPQCATDTRLYRRMVAAHNLAITDGLTAETPEYFAAVEKTMGFGSTDVAPVDATSEAAQPVQRRQSPPAAPVSRGSNGGGGGPTTVRLTAEEREIAAMNGMTDQEYAKNKLALVKEGRLN